MQYTVAIVILSNVSFHFYQTESRIAPRPTIVWRKASPRIDTAIKVTECGNRTKRYSVREIPLKRCSRCHKSNQADLPLQYSNVSGVAGGSSNSISLQVAAMTESNTYEYREIEKID